jgi:hypothetical protein
MRKGIVFIWLTVLMLGVVALFWYNEWVYSLPTPVPLNYKAVARGARIDLAWKFNDHKPVFLHFYNPDCPCSRFNKPYFKKLVQRYGTAVDFAIVLMNRKDYSAGEIQAQFDLRIPVLFDPAIAKACGVYSTPQAAIIDTDRTLYYCGNYNRSRYCTDDKTNYANMALVGLLHRNTGLIFDQFALKAYGCQAPKCTK